ncbi:MAG TPA: SDR family NAD(P)-dependent oxidoreductase [Steroidobacteraceae bacterium]|nr:SDR family NAD(P)-dependent oxidoreductase [Steroidobacteraceae bacterium]
MAAQFGPESTADQVLEGIDLRGRQILVTGTSAGLGVETARALVSRGAQVVGAVRDLPKAERATASMRAQVARGGRFELVSLDLASLASVRACADALVAAGKRFDVIIANAGVMACPRGKTADGFETQFGTNHLGHFVLINRLLPLLGRGSRVICLSSAGHRFSDVDLDDPSFERTPYVEFVAYGRSKTANALFVVELDRRHRGEGIRAAAVHPGAIETELGRSVTPEVMQQLTRFGSASSQATGPANFRWKSVAQGAATSVWCAAVADAEAIGGRYCEDCHVAEIVPGSDTARRNGVRAYAIDPERARALWAKSEQMVGERF